MHRIALLATASLFALLLATGCSSSGGYVIPEAPTPSARGQQPSSAQRVGAVLVVRNASREPVIGVFVRQTGTQSWGDNVLAHDIPMNGTLTLTDIPAGRWDILVVDSSRNFKIFENERMDWNARYNLEVDHQNWERLD